MKNSGVMEYWSSGRMRVASGKWQVTLNHVGSGQASGKWQKRSTTNGEGWGRKTAKARLFTPLKQLR